MGVPVLPGQQAVTEWASANFLRLRAALTSRSWSTPQVHCHSRIERGAAAMIAPHEEQVFDEGKNRSASTMVDPANGAL